MSSCHLLLLAFVVHSPPSPWHSWAKVSAWYNGQNWSSYGYCTVGLDRVTSLCLWCLINSERETWIPGWRPQASDLWLYGLSVVPVAPAFAWPLGLHPCLCSTSPIFLSEKWALRAPSTPRRVSYFSMLIVALELIFKPQKPSDPALSSQFKESDIVCIVSSLPFFTQFLHILFCDGIFSPQIHKYATYNTDFLK